ncbi:MAG: hypothetical protein JXA09_12340 [Anaerolineae bacterium]|nr:hypothetical protein [Anaerolineae bacterium]
MPYAECYVTPQATIRRRRALPVPGRVLCRYGDQVASDRIIAEADVAMGYHLLDLAYHLQTRRIDMGRVLVKKVGDPVEAGEVIARAGWLFRTECRSPAKGKLIDARRGKVLIETVPEHIDLRALYPGSVVNVIPERGALIEITCALVQGAWGTGRELRGQLDCVVPDRESVLTADMIHVSQMGTVLVGGRTLDRRAIDAAVENEVGAVVVGSLSSGLLPAIEASGLSAIATEGFGDFAMSARMFDLLLSNVGREACLSPAVRTRWAVHRPEIVIPLAQEARAPALEPGMDLAVGSPVRVLRAPYANVLGQVSALPAMPRRLASGVRARVAEVDLGPVGKAYIPFENLEILR